MKTPLIIGVSALTLLTLSATLFAQTTTGSSLITQMKAATHAFTLSGDLNSGATDLESSPLVGKKTGDMLSAGEYNRLLELVGQGGGGGGTAVYDSGWFSAHSNGATYKTGEGGIPAYTLGKKADIIKLYFRANATSPEREVPSFQMSGAESAWSLAWGDIYGPRPVTLDSSYISIQYGTSVGGACYKFGPGFSSPCGFNGSNIYYEDVGQLKIVAYSFGGTGGGGGGGGVTLSEQTYNAPTVRDVTGNGPYYISCTRTDAAYYCGMMGSLLVSMTCKDVSTNLVVGINYNSGQWSADDHYVAGGANRGIDVLKCANGIGAITDVRE